jgi:hypothetical protein
MTKEEILDEIKRIAAANDSIPPGAQRFRSETGISESAWSGKYWARWGDALREAGFSPNVCKRRIAMMSSLKVMSGSSANWATFRHCVK